jgi:peroxiredoxin
MIQAGDSIPHFDVTRISGSRIEYTSIWQRKNLVLVLLPATESPESMSYISRVADRLPDLTAYDTECVVTRDVVSDVPGPAVVIADRWGEVCKVWTGSNVADFPDVDAILEWLRFVQMQCPECEGESH